jgi:hypothetical protein
MFRARCKPARPPSGANRIRAFRQRASAIQQSWPQRSLLLRLGQKIQKVLWRGVVTANPALTAWLTPKGAHAPGISSSLKSRPSSSPSGGRLHSSGAAHLVPGTDQSGGAWATALDPSRKSIGEPRPSAAPSFAEMATPGGFRQSRLIRHIGIVTPHLFRGELRGNVLAPQPGLELFQCVYARPKRKRAVKVGSTAPIRPANHEAIAPRMSAIAPNNAPVATESAATSAALVA